MITLNKPIDVVTHTDISGKMLPKRFRIIAEDESETVIHIKSVLTMDKVKIDNTANIVYKCRVTINDTVKQCILRYIIMEMKWLLYQM